MSAQYLAEILRAGAHSLVVSSRGRIHAFDSRGVADLYRIIREDPGLLAGADVADKVVGKGAAALMALGGIASLHAGIISTPALAMLRQAGVSVSFDAEVPHIINRQATGICPVERLCDGCTTPEQCLPLIEKFMSETKTS